MKLRALFRGPKHIILAARLWYLSGKAYRAGYVPLAKLLKAVNFFAFHCILCYECEVEDDLELFHNGFGCAVHPNVKIGKRVTMYHHVTLAAETPPGSAPRIVIEDDCVIGANVTILGNDSTGITIGRGSKIGACAVVVRDVPPGSTIVALPSRPVKVTAP